MQLGVRRPVPNEVPGWAYVESLAEMPGRGPLEANRLSELVANTIRIEACPDCVKVTCHNTSQCWCAIHAYAAAMLYHPRSSKMC